MPSTSPVGPSAGAAPNATAAAAAAWTNVSLPEMPLFHRFAQLDEQLHASFPGLWLALMAAHGVIFLAGMVLNGLALYVFGCRTRAKTPSVVYTINLVVTDLLVGLSLPTRFAVFYGPRGSLRCALPHVFGYFLNMHCSILFLSCICVDRYLAIVRPGGSRRWRQPACARAVCAFVWLAAGALTVLVIFLVCFTPFHARQVAVALWPGMPHHASLVAYHVAVTLSSLNSCMDPIVYCFVTSSFQATVRGLCGRRGAECEPNSCDVVSVHKSSKGSAHHHILRARAQAVTQALPNGPDA
ncbi:PREDICTED: G-protein coupled receptor 20 [Bison bison bison]|uniref:G-protein coupled receptor 20 n=1 Tax=Bison bison bison TaxID=43346 RepID=A0A6P3H1U8_BISBB|nr:PREDICTED: G-protein coupled receptor 20 [Bison bison bison]